MLKENSRYVLKIFNHKCLTPKIFQNYTSSIVQIKKKRTIWKTPLEKSRCRCGKTRSWCLPTTRAPAGCWWGTLMPKETGEPQSEPVACGILVHEPGVRPKLLGWEIQVQTTGLTENLRSQGIFIRVRSHGVPHLSSDTYITTVSHDSLTRFKFYCQKVYHFWQIYKKIS